MTKVHKVKIVSGGAALILLVFLIWAFFWPLDRGDQEKREVIVAKGSGLSKIAGLLEKEGIIRHRYLFLFYAFLTGQEKNFQAGRYHLSSAMNIPEVSEILAKGLAESDDIILVVPEGFNAWEIDRRLSKAGLIESGHFWKLAKNQEGYLFPDSYRLPPPGANDEEDWIRRTIEKMRKRFAEKTKLGGKDLDQEKVIIASILEKEVRKQEDMAMVAGIIYERLSRGWPLQIDATVAYGACRQGGGEEVPPYQSRDRYCDVTQINLLKWLKINGPFNTYQRLGLPPSPIANPGEKSLWAAAHPQDSPYLYYLSSPTDGQTIFSRTAEEQARSRAKYLGR